MIKYILYLCVLNNGCVLYDDYAEQDECMYYGIMIKTVNPVERLCLEVVRDE